MSRSVQDTRLVTASADSGESAATGDELARTWNATVTSDPAAPSSFLDVITASLDSNPSGMIATPHGRTATPLESCPPMTGCRTAASTGAYATIDSHELVHTSWTTHAPPLCSSADVGA
jgi:hypothetical protein